MEKLEQMEAEAKRIDGDLAWLQERHLRTVAERSEWQMRAIAAEETLRHDQRVTLMRGDFKPKAERKNGYAVLSVESTGTAVLLDESAVLMCCLALGIVAVPESRK